MLVLCDACRRHVKIEDEACPFCGSRKRAPSANWKTTSSPRSRAQRYALGAAIAASIGIAKASGQEAPRAVAPAPSTSSTPIATDDAGANVNPHSNDPPQEDWRMHRGGGSCTTSGGGCCGGPARVACPPYGCVFPDEACDIIRV